MKRKIGKIIGLVSIIGFAIITAISWGGMSNDFGLFIISLFTTLACIMWCDFVNEGK